MKKINLIQTTITHLLPALACFVCSIVQAQKIINQPPEYIFTTYTAADGLPSSEILSLAFDKKGFLWAGTSSGLSRYDGYTFTNFSYSADNHFIGMVNVIKTDTAGKIWVGASSGLYCYLKTRLVKISGETKIPPGVNDMIANDNGSLWLATENGPAFINAADIDASGAKKIMLQKFILPQWINKYAPLYGPQCQLIKKAQDNTVYFSHQYQLFSYSKNNMALVHNTKQENDKIEFIIPVSSTKVFYNAAITGLNKVENGAYTDLDFENLYKPYKKPATEGIWYVGSLGIVCFHPDEAFISQSISFKEKGASWLSFILKQHTVSWLATHNGLIKIKPSVFQLHSADTFKNINETFSFCELKDGRFLAGANHGEIYQVGEAGATNFFPGGLKPVPHAEIKCMYQDERGWLWIGTGYQGIALSRTGKITRFTNDTDNLQDNSFNYFLAAKNKKLFAIGDKGMTEVMVDEKEKISFKPFFSQPVLTKYAKFYSGIEAPDGTIWIGGEEGLCFLQHDSLHQFSLFEKNINVRSIKISKDNTVWIVTAGDGIICCRFDEKNKLQLVKQYNEKDGLNTLQFLDLFIDKEDNIWAGSVKGLTFIGRKGQYKNKLVNFSEADGFIKPGYYSMKLYQDKKGEIWAGTSNGICSFMPDELFLSAAVPKIYLTAVDFLKAKKKSVNIDSLVASGKQQNFSLPYFNNSLNFHFTAIDDEGTKGMQYYYRMDGLDSNWINGGNIRSVIYHNLAAGNYVFRVKALSNKGSWSRQEAAFVFVIHPAFWQTVWFRLLCAATVAFAIYLFVKRREKFIVKQEVQKTEIEKIKTISFRHQLEIEQVTNFFAVSIHQQNTVDEMLWDVARNCIAKLNFEDCVIYLKDEKRNVLIQKAAWGPKTTDENKIVNPIEIPVGKGIVGHVAESRKPAIVADTAADARYIVDDMRRQSEMAVPILSNKILVGVIDSEHSQKKFYTERHLQIITTIASLLGNKIEQMNAEEKARAKEIEVLTLNKDLVTSQLTALRSQMNPHFIFNALNSIQQFTLKNDTDNANLYLSKFSTLLRKVLHSSQQDFITVEEETAQLALYLDIEKLRMGAGFTYSITTDEQIETDAVKIPGMLIQPLAENALKHGLAIKEGAKELQIAFHLSGDDKLDVTIIDNGVGRKKAAELKQLQQKMLPRQSKGISLVEERLKLLNGVAAQSIVYTEDLYDSCGQPAGTKVSISIPLHIAGV